MSDLVSDLDKAIGKLLRNAGLGDSVEVQSAANTATLSEQVKAFDSAMEYARIRPSLIPKEVVESEFARLKREFDGDAPARRGRRAKAQKAEPDGDDDEPANQLFS